MAKDYFIIVDMQNDFIDGSLANKDAKKIVPEIVRNLQYLNDAGYDPETTEIVFTRDTHSEDYLNTPEGKKLPVPHCIEGTHGWEINSEIANAVPVGYTVKCVDKPTFGYTGWDSVISNDAETIIICGTCTDICVVSNALAIRALFPNALIFVAEKLCAGLTKKLHKSALDVMRSCQIEVI